MERRARFFLNACGLFTPAQQNQLLGEVERAEDLFNASHIFGKAGLSHSDWLRSVDLLEKARAYESLLSVGVQFLLKEDDDYPSSLHFVDTPPQLLYIKGSIPKTSLCGLSMIGTRHPTVYGRKMAKEFAAKCSEAGFVIVSGCAQGVDTEALRGALEAGGEVVGVLGNGIQTIYPAHNAKLYQDIIKQGALVSEFPPEAKPLKHHFPWRNRLISGWGLGVLVVEATVRSGTAGTVRWALDQGKEVFAIPGPVTSEASRGCHRMIREGAHLVEFPDEIIEFFAEELKPLRVKEKIETNPIPPFEEHELGLIESPRDIDELMEISGLAYSELVGKLNRAVMEGIAKKCPGGCYALA